MHKLNVMKNQFSRDFTCFCHTCARVRAYTCFGTWKIMFRKRGHSRAFSILCNAWFTTSFCRSIDPFLTSLAENLPDALEHDCAGCSEPQKNAADKISHHLIDHKPDDWKLLEDKYDPTGAYRRRYLDNKSTKDAGSTFD